MSEPTTQPKSEKPWTEKKLIPFETPAKAYAFTFEGRPDVYLCITLPLPVYKALDLHETESRRGNFKSLGLHQTMSCIFDFDPPEGDNGHASGS